MMSGLPSPETGAEEMEAIARDEIARMPEELQAHLGNVVIRVEDFADREVLDSLGIPDPWNLSGLYQGVALPHQSALDVRQEMDMIFLYRRPILAESATTGVALETLVRHVLVHEVGHHFGFSDEDMHRLEDDAARAGDD